MQGYHKIRGCYILVILILIALSTSGPVECSENKPQILLLRLEGTVTTGLSSYLKKGMDKAAESEMEAVIIKINTPGGLVDATLETIKDIINSPVPIITYVAPRGAIAASAGSFLLLSGHVAAMAPGTTCGAAMPVAMSPTDGESRPADDKTINFLAGHMKSIARERERSAEIAEKFVTENLTLDAREARDKTVIDLIASDLESLLLQLDGHQTKVLDEEITLNTEKSQLVELEMTVQQQLAHLLSNPQIALLLFMIGFYGIIFGLNSPGTLIPETLGAVALILALFGLGMFEINLAGILLITAAVILFIAEVFTPTFGILTLMGLGSLVLGALLLPVEPMLPVEWFHNFRMIVLGIAVATGLFFLVVISRLARLRHISPFHSRGELSTYRGRTVEELDPEGMVKIRGEWWQARSIDGEKIPAGASIEVKEKRGMVLIVKNVSNENHEREV